MYSENHKLCKIPVREYSVTMPVACVPVSILERNLSLYFVERRGQVQPAVWPGNTTGEI